MALARWARSDDPKPYTLYTRREVDGWILPHIDRTDTLFSVLEKYFYFTIFRYQNITKAYLSGFYICDIKQSKYFLFIY